MPDATPVANPPQKLSALPLIASSIALLTEIVTNISNISDRLDKHFLITVAALWGATVVFAQTTRLGDPSRTTVRRYGIIGLATLLAGIPLGWKYWQYYEHNRRVVRPADLPNIKLQSLLRLGVVSAAEQPLRLSFFLNEDLSSFHLVQDHRFGQGPLVPTYAVDLQIHEAFRSGSCTGVDGDRPAQVAVPVLRNFWATQSRPDLSAYLTQPNSLGRLIRERGDIFSQIIPTSAQFASMPPADYEVVKAWIHDCVGLYLPVFTFALENQSDKDVTLTRIVYHVHQIGTVKGSVAGALLPLKTYDYTLAWKAGDQVQNIAFVVPAHQQSAFDLRLSPGSTDAGITWWMNIEVIGSDGSSAKTDDFQLTMNKGK